MGTDIRAALTLEQCWHRVPGGTAVAGIGLAKALDALDGIQVVGVAAKHKEPPPEAWAPPIPVKQLGLPRVALYSTWHLYRAPRVQTATGDIDVIHATTFAIPPRSAPLVVTIHDLAFLNDPTHFTRRGMKFFRRGLRLARSEADLILCPSEFTLKDCRRNGFEAKRLRHVPLGIESEVATTAEVERVRSKYGLERPYIMWTGTIEPRKNLPRLVKAFGSLDLDMDLVLVGPRGWNEDVQRFTKGSRRADVKPIGFVPLEELPALYAGATVFCFPSLFEGFGLPILEAMMQGTPVVTSKGTSTQEIAGSAAVLVDPRTARSIADGIRKVVDDDGLASELSAAGRERAIGFTWKRTAELTLEAYREAMG